jgi:DNA polymerase
MNHIFLDFETISHPDTPLKQYGTYRYIFDDAFKVVCGYMAVNNEEPQEYTGSLFKELADDPANVFIAHNVFFEQTIIRKLFPQYHGKLRWKDTQAMGRYFGISGKLETLANVLLKSEKELEGVLIRKKTLDRGVWPDDYQLQVLKQYCRQDVIICRQLFYRFHEYFPKKEQRISELTDKANHRGICVDVSLTKKAIVPFEVRQKQINEELALITNGAIDSIDKVEQLQKYLDYTSINRLFLEDILKQETDPTKRKIIELRLEGAQKTAYKLLMIIRMVVDGRLRNAVVYYGALTGRFSSKGVQLQNLKKVKDGLLKSIIEKETLTHADAQVLVRGIFIASPNRLIYRADYSQIEARIAAWICDEFWMTKAFRNQEDIYKIMASTIFKKPIDSITKEERHEGKIAVLGCGYGMGVKLFSSTYKLDEKESKKLITAYRNKCPHIKRFWNTLHNSIIKLIETGGFIQLPKGIRLTMINGKDLKITLPSKTAIFYRDIRIKRYKKDNDWRVGFVFKKSPLFKDIKKMVWGGTFFENICQRIARDILCEAIIRLDKREGCDLLFNVHDELIYDVIPEKLTLTDFKSEIIKPPAWSHGLTIDAEANSGKRYYE